MDASRRQDDPASLIGTGMRESIRRVAGAIALLDIEDFDFTGTPIREPLIRDLATGAFLANQPLPEPVSEAGPAAVSILSSTS
jgi:hypothetical protein